MPVIALKIVSAFAFEIWWIVSDDMRVCNFLIISNTSLQSKERHIRNGKTRQHIRAKMNTQAYIAQKQLFYLIELIFNMRFT